MRDVHTTNDERPFEPGELVQWDGCTYVVEANHGEFGVVGDYFSGERIANFYWTYGADVTRRLGKRVRFSRPADPELALAA